MVVSTSKNQDGVLFAIYESKGGFKFLKVQDG